MSLAVKKAGPLVVASPATAKICFPQGVCCETGVTEPPVKEPASCAPLELVSEKAPPEIAQLVFEPNGQFERA